MPSRSSHNIIVNEHNTPKQKRRLKRMATGKKTIAGLPSLVSAIEANVICRRPAAIGDQLEISTRQADLCGADDLPGLEQ